MIRVYDQIKRAFQDLIAPELHAIRGDLRLLDQKIDEVDARLSTKIDGVDGRLTAQIDAVGTRLTARIDALDQTIDGVDARLTVKIDALAEKFDGLDARLGTRMDSLRSETLSLKGELLAEIRRLDTGIDGVDRELRTAMDIRERLATLEARRTP